MRRLILALAIPWMLAAIAVAPASAAVACDGVAAPSGSDSNPGTVTSPFRTAQKLVDSLTSGQTGCLRAGAYGSPTTQTNFSTPGVTITTYPGDTTATIQGFAYVPASGSGVTLSDLNIDNNRAFGSWPALCAGGVGGGAIVTDGFTVDANNVTVEHDNIYVDASVPLIHRGMGMGVGFNNSTSGDVIRYNRIHDVGFCPVEEHGIYLNKTNGIQIYGNWIYNIPAGTGIQVWDGPTKAHIYANVVDGASSCFDLGGNSPITVGNVIEHNICSNMVGVQQPYKAYCASPGPGCTGPDPGQPLFDWWETGTAGSGNVMQNNLVYCASTAHCTTSFAGTSGVAIAGNISANPGFADSSYQTSHDYRVASDSPAASWGLWDGDLAGSASRPVSPSTASSATPSATVPPTTVPSPPSAVTATAGDRQVTVSWASNPASDGVIHYNVYRTGQTFVVPWVAPTTTTFTNRDQVVDGTTYCYEITATNVIGVSTRSQPVCATPEIG